MSDGFFKTKQPLIDFNLFIQFFLYHLPLWKDPKMFYASKRNYSFDYFTSLTIFFLSFKQTVASLTVLDYL